MFLLAINKYFVTYNALTTTKCIACEQQLTTTKKCLLALNRQYIVLLPKVCRQKNVNYCVSQYHVVTLNK